MISGIEVEESKNSHLKNVTLHSNVGKSIELKNSNHIYLSEIYLTNNTIEKSEGAGLYITFSDYIFIKNCEIKDNYGYSAAGFYFH